MSEKMYFGFYWLLWLLTWLVSTQAGVYTLRYMAASQYGMVMGWIAALTVIVAFWLIWLVIIGIIQRYVQSD